MTVQPSPYDQLRILQDQIAVLHASLRALDRAANTLSGMLDGSAPDPIMYWKSSPADVSINIPAPVAAADPSPTRPGAVLEIDGKTVLTTKRRATLLSMVMTAPQTLDAMARAGVSPTVAGMKAQIRDVNGDLERAGVTRLVRMQALPAQRRGARGGREPALYALLPPKDEETAPLENPTAAQDEAAAGVSPGEEAPASAAGDGECIMPAQGAPFVMSPGAGEGHVTPADPAPAADEPKQPTAIVRVLDAWAATTDDVRAIAEAANISTFAVRRYLTAGRAANEPRVVAGDKARSINSRSDDPPPSVVPASPPAASTRPHAGSLEGKPITAPAPPPPRTGALTIEPGDLIAVDIKNRRVTTPKGSYEVAGANLARALDFMKPGHLFGLDVIARKAGWPTADAAKTSLGYERNRLAEHGIDLHIDKINARLRVPA